MVCRLLGSRRKAYSSANAASAKRPDDAKTSPCFLDSPAVVVCTSGACAKRENDRPGLRALANNINAPTARLNRYCLRAKASPGPM